MHVIPEVRHDSWNERVDAERQFRYYNRLAHRYRNWHLWLTIGVIVVSILAGSAGIIVFEAIPEPAPWIGVVLGNLLLVVSASVGLMELSKKSAQANAASNYYAQMARLWRQFWWRQHDETAVKEMRFLQYFSPPDVQLGVNEKLNKECHDQANAIVQAEYAAASGRREGDAS